MRVRFSPRFCMYQIQPIPKRNAPIETQPLRLRPRKRKVVSRRDIYVFAALIPLTDLVQVAWSSEGVWAQPAWTRWVEYTAFYALLLLGAVRRWGMFGRPGAQASSSRRRAAST